MSAEVSSIVGHKLAPPADRPVVASVAKATQLLRAFTTLAPVLSVRQLSHRTGIPRSTVHGLCVTLVEGGLLEEAPPRGYQLGQGLVDLGGQVIERTGLVDAAHDVLTRLRRREGTESHVGQLVDGWIIYLHRTSGPVHAPMDNRVGLRVPAHLTGCGRAALSRLPVADALERAERSCRAERRGAINAQALEAALAKARKRGYALGSTFQTGRLSVAAPVMHPGGWPVGGISLAGPTGIFDEAYLQAVAKQVCEAAAVIGRALPALSA
jgi:DNA-binding IclR family transcriptional regulator